MSKRSKLHYDVLADERTIRNVTDKMYTTSSTIMPKVLVDVCWGNFLNEQNFKLKQVMLPKLRYERVRTWRYR